MEKESNQDNSRGTAVPFVIYSNKRFIVTDEAKEILSKYEYKNIGIISLVGKYRTGKSFLLNRVLLNQKRESGFDVGPTIRPCTKGIWMWSKPLFIENNHCKEKFPVFMIDTEGLGAYDEEINHDTKIFLIAVLISSVFIFNSFGNIDENSINSLSFILNLSKTIKLKESEGLSGGSGGDSVELAKYFPSLVWLLRDFSLKLEDSEGNTITAKQYLENALQLQKGSSEIVEEKNKIRKMITTYFPERDCFSMVRPVENETDLQNLQSLDDSKIRREFLDQAETLRHKVSKKVKPKMFNNKILSGSMLVELLGSILDSINQGAIPVIENSWKYVMHNESIKNMSSTLKSYITQITKFKEENKDNPSFFSDLESFQKNLEKNLIEEFQKSTVMDETSANDFLSKLKQKMSEEYKKFNDENSKFFENRMMESLEKNTKKLCDTFETDKYAKNYYQFFQDLENLKEITEASTPDFPMKKEIIFEKLLTIIKKFIEMTFLKNKILNEKEIVGLRNELQTLTNKFNIQTGEFEAMKSETKDAIEKLNNQVVEYKMREKNIEEKVKSLDAEKKNIISSSEKKIAEMKKEMEDTVEKVRKDLQTTRTELKNKEDQLLLQKFAEEKMTALNTQKMEFLEREINSHKERYEQLKKETSEYRTTIEELNTKIDELKSENNKKKIIEYELERLKTNQGVAGNFSQGFVNYGEGIVGNNNQGGINGFNSASPINMPPTTENLPINPESGLALPESDDLSRTTPKHPGRPFMQMSTNPYLVNENKELVNLLKSQLESSKSQIEETKKMYEEVISTLKLQTSTNSNKENLISPSEYKELMDSNKSLSISLSNNESRCSKLEEKIQKLKSLKNTFKSAAALQCKFCAKFFAFDVFVVHSQNCQQDILKNSIDNFNKKSSPDKLKIKILKGILNKDELGKPYIEYIIEITYNTQNWRVNKKFNQFANLHKTLKSLFTDVKFPDSAGLFSKINMNGKDSNNYHENKIKLLEKYLKDISDIGIVNKSKPFRKFFDFEDYIDEDVNQSLPNDTFGGFSRNTANILGEDTLAIEGEDKTAAFDAIEDSVEVEEVASKNNETEEEGKEVSNSKSPNEKKMIHVKKNNTPEKMANVKKIVTMNVNMANKEKIPPNTKRSSTINNTVIAKVQSNKSYSSKKNINLNSSMVKDKNEGSVSKKTK